MKKDFATIKLLPLMLLIVEYRCKQQMYCILTEIQQRYYKLQDKAGRKLDTLGKQLTKHKVLETDIAKAESWLNDSQPIASQPMDLQCPIQAIQAQLEEQQVKIYSSW